MHRYRSHSIIKRNKAKEGVAYDTYPPRSLCDAPALLDIYAPYVIGTAITFEYEVPTLDDFRQRIKNTLHTHPYLVMERDGEIVG